MVHGLFHVAIHSSNLKATENFYCRVLGMAVAERPPFSFPGLWLRPAVPGAPAIIHVYGVDSVPAGTGAVDHVALACVGYGRMRTVLTEYGLSWRATQVPNTALRQLFVYDPSGVLLELTFDIGGEPDAPTDFPDERRNKSGKRSWFDPTEYAAFA